VSSATPDRWPEVEAALDAALGAPPEDRADIVRRICSDDETLRREVESLLAAHEAVGGVLDTSVESFAAPLLARAVSAVPAESTGMVISRYRLIEEIGRGGMGTVWLAERADGQYEQRVALKIVKRGMDTDEILARFRRERQILARLEHRNIARLLDGGVTDDGRPFFVMEHVAGEPITDACDRRGLGIDERLKLFAVVCRAVGFAHRNLVIHRDIKPSNVLVDGNGEIKLLDFGIARLLHDGEESAPATIASPRFLTPEFASPEQNAGEPVTTASDVYQLGALLYVLLTGERPASGEDRRMPRRLRGDLETIALRALRPEPHLRYPGAEALAEDVERHLECLPIRFGGDRLAYRARKFVRRHRVGVLAGTGVLALMVALVAFDMARVRGERDRARHEADKAMETAQLMGRFLQGWSPDASDRGVVSAEKMLRDAARRAERELQGRPEMLAATLSVLGDLHTTLGEWRAADSLLARAQTVQEGLSDEPGVDLAATLARRGRLYRTLGDHERAEAALQRALSLHQSLLGPRHLETLRVRRELAILRRQEERWEESEDLSRDILAAMSEEDRAAWPFALETATDLGYALFQQARFDEAIEILRPTLERQRAIFGEVHASTLFTIRALGSAHRDRGDLEEAETLYREALRIAEALYGAEHAETEAAIFVLALVLQREEELAAAETWARRSLELSRRLYGPDHIVLLGRRGLVGAILLDRGDADEAERELRIMLDGVLAAGGGSDPDLGDVRNRLAYLAVKRDANDAGTVYREAVTLDESRPAGSPIFVTDGIHFLAWAEHRRGDLALAEEDYRRSLALYRRQLPIGHAYRAAAASGLGAMLLESGRAGEARDYLREGLAQWEAHVPPEPELLREVGTLIARADSVSGRESAPALTARTPAAP
jgi:serine/threonine-protein kinase